MRNFLAPAIGALLLIAAAPAADAASYETARQLAEVTALRTEIDKAIGDAVATLRNQFAQQGMPQEKADQFLAAFRDALENDAQTLVDDLTRIYADRFSDAEIEDLVRFYQTPTGQKLVKLQHEIAQEQTLAVARWIVAAAQKAAENLAAKTGASV